MSARILFACHKHPYANNPRGAEKSVAAIMQYLIGCGYDVHATAPGVRHTKQIEGVTIHSNATLIEQTAASDLVLTWGRAAPEAAAVALACRKPYILMVRWWRLITPTPAQSGDLMTAPINDDFRRRHQWIFDEAAAVITNTKYSADVIRRIYGREAIVSYVPILAPSGCGFGDPGGYLTVITPEVYGEYEVVAALSQLNRYRFLIVNSGSERDRFAALPGVTILDYTADMDADVWAKTAILLQPVMFNDICGTKRTTIEAFARGIPVVASARSGMGEKVPMLMLVSRESSFEMWSVAIDSVLNSYTDAQDLAREAWKRYDTASQLDIFRKEIEKALCYETTRTR